MCARDRGLARTSLVVFVDVSIALVGHTGSFVLLDVGA